MTEINRGRAARDALRTAWRVAGAYSDQTVGEAIKIGCTSHPDDHIVFAQVDGETTLVTLGAFLQRAQTSAGRLAAAGVRTGDVVVVQAPADLKGTEILAAVWLLHAVTVPIATTATVEEVADAIRETGARYAVVAPAWRGRDLVSPLVAASDLPRLQRVLVIGDATVDGAVALGSVEPIPVPPGPRPDPWSVACVLSHVGLDGSAKGSAAQPRDVAVRTRRGAHRRQQSDARDLPRRPCGFADQSSPTTDGRWDNGRDGPLERPSRSRAD